MPSAARAARRAVAGSQLGAAQLLEGLWAYCVLGMGRQLGGAMNRDIAADRKNLLSLSAIDFGIIVDGAIVMMDAILRRR